MNIQIKAKVVCWISVLLLFLFPFDIPASEVFVRAKTGKSTLQWGEPCQIELTVYSQTWFTDGVSFPDMKDPNGVLIKNDRSYTGSEYIDGVRYSMVSQGYLYYPLTPGKQKVAFDIITVSSPSPGKIKGEKRSFSFPEKIIDVRPVQEQRTRISAASRLTLHQKLELTDTLRVGDVISRTIECRAAGVPAAFISMPVPADTLSFCKIIPEVTGFRTIVDEGSVSGRATRSYLYQLTDTGTFRIPDFEMLYWNTRSKQTDSVRIAGINIKVLPALISELSDVSGKAIESDVHKGNRHLPALFILIPCITICVFSNRKRFVRFFNQIRNTTEYRIMSASDYPSLYDTLYLIAAEASCSGFAEMAARNSEAEKLYAKFQYRLFREGYTGKCSLKLRLSFLSIIIKLRK